MNAYRSGPARQVRTVVAALLVAVCAVRGLTAGVRSADDTATAEPLCIYGGSNGALYLIQMHEVARELALTPAQTQQLTRLAEELRAETRRLGRGLLGGGTGPQDAQRAADKARQAAAITETFHRRALEGLARAQQIRLDELYVRYLGPRALFEPRVAARVGLSASQQQALRDAVTSRPTPPPFEELLKQLTADQYERLAALQGRPFSFPKPQFIQSEPGQPKRAR